MSRVSVVIPVKDGERYLGELLAAVARESPEEVLVIDSGSRDASVQIARDAGAEVLRIDPSEFGHGRTRNLGAERTQGELICFLTQDATPCPGWLAAYRQAFGLEPRVGAAYGPHLARPGTSPMVARELEEFFAGFSPDGEPRVQRLGDPPFLSNVNACYSRRCWEEIRFRDLSYAEDQAFGADLLAAGWTKVYQPQAAVLHSHDYGYWEFMRRYFDEYRGLRSSLGHVERLGLRSTLAMVTGNMAGDRRWMAQRGLAGSELLRWTFRSGAHHAGRKLFSFLGSHSQQLPKPVRLALSLERHYQPGLTGEGPPAAPSHPEPATSAVAAWLERSEYELAMRVRSQGEARLVDPPPGTSSRRRLRIAMVIPPFSRGSGGHNTLFQILMRLEGRGHVCSVWLHDYYGHMRSVWPARVREEIREYFAPIQGAVYKGFDDWHGADVVIATGWETVHPALTLPGCYARAYLVNDHEPDFYAQSVERVLAEDTYRHGMHCIAASPWLADLLHSRYGASADAFQLGVDHAVYHPRELTRRRDTILYYARYTTPRRAVPVGLMALGELHRRRPEARMVLFGTEKPIATTFPYRHAGVLSPDQLACLYSQATVGLCLSMTNFSLMPKEMLACGLPCVELAGVSAESIFGPDGPLELAGLDPLEVADALEKLLDDQELWEQRSRAGMDFVASHTWDHATDQVEAGLRHALSLREQRTAWPDGQNGSGSTEAIDHQIATSKPL